MLLFLLMQWRRSGGRMHLVEPTYILLHFHWVYLFSHTQYFLIPYHRSAKGWFCIWCLQSCLLYSRQGFWKNSAWPWRMNDKRITLHRIHNYPSARLVIYRNRLKGKGTVKRGKPMHLDVYGRIQVAVDAWTNWATKCVIKGLLAFVRTSYSYIQIDGRAVERTIRSRGL
jgi:hypothetical protein